MNAVVPYAVILVADVIWIEPEAYRNVDAGRPGAIHPPPYGLSPRL